MKKQINIGLTSLLVTLVISGCSTKQEIVHTQQDKNVTQSLDENITKVPVITESILEEKAVDKTQEDNESKDLSLPNSIYFGFDNYKIDTIQTKMLSQYIIDNKKNFNNTQILLEGNTDFWGSDEYNYALGLKRATNVKSILIENGFNKDSILLKSYGESNLLCTTKTKECNRKNRRVDFKFVE